MDIILGLCIRTILMSLIPILKSNAQFGTPIVSVKTQTTQLLNIGQDEYSFKCGQESSHSPLYRGGGPVAKHELPHVRRMPAQRTRERHHSPFRLARQKKRLGGGGGPPRRRRSRRRGKPGRGAPPRCTPGIRSSTRRGKDSRRE